MPHFFEPPAHRTAFVDGLDQNSGRFVGEQ